MVEDGSRSPPAALRWLAYVGMFALAAALFALVLRHGAGIVAPDVAAGASRFGPGQHAGGSALTHVLVALTVIVLVSRAMGMLFQRIGQPSVVGEVTAGILLGPSVLGRFAPGVSAAILPSTVGPYLGVLSQVGVVLFMFLVGLELDPKLLRGKTGATIAVSHASIVVPFVAGGALALVLYPRLSSSDVPFHAFALFLGVAMSVTAFPVLARILGERNLSSTSLGALALSCAAVDDVTAWCLLAFVVGIARADATGALVTMGLSAAFVAVVVLVARPLLVRAVRSREGKGPVSAGGLAGVLVGLLLSALATEWIGIHALFGAFLFGAVLPHDTELARDVHTRLEGLVVVLFLPTYFAFTGLRTQIGLVDGAAQWGLCGLIILVATFGKFGGAFAAARFSGLTTRNAAAIGVLMNTRGLMELVVLNVGLDLGVISPVLFAMMVLMALVTTFATSPLLGWIVPGPAGAVGGVPSRAA